MASTKALGRFALWVAWMFQVLIWAIGATALFLSRAIEIGCDQSPVYFTYTTPLYLNDVLEMIASVHPLQLFVPNRPNIVLWACVLSAMVLILDRKREIRNLWRTIVIGVQLYMFGIFAPLGFTSLFSDLPRLWNERLDGEWLGEGWNHFEASALWLPTILILLVLPLCPLVWDWLRGVLPPEPEGVPFRQC